MLIIRQCENKKVKKIVHSCFALFDIIITLLCLVEIFISIDTTCLTLFYIYYTLFYIGQVIEHFLVIRLPDIDAEKYAPKIKVFIYIFGFFETTYLFGTVMFWLR